MARRLGDEIGQRVFEQRKVELDAAFEEKYKGFLGQWKVQTVRARTSKASNALLIDGTRSPITAEIFQADKTTSENGDRLLKGKRAKTEVQMST